MPQIDFGIQKKIALSEIYTGDRARKEFGDIPALMKSIQINGLIHPLVVYSPSGNPPYTLLAGGRRFYALTKLGQEEAPCRVYNHEMTTEELRSIELFENLDRLDFHYSEKSALLRELHDHLVKVYGEKVTRSPEAEGHSMRDTAKLVGKSIGSVSGDIALAEAIEKYPELNLDKLPNKTIASKVLKRFEQAMINQKALDIIQPDETENFLSTKIIHSYKHGDFLEDSPELPSEEFNLIEVDPPYGIDLHKLRANEGSRGLEYSSYIEVDKEEYSGFIYSVAKECFRAAAPDSYILWWLGPQWYHEVWRVLTYVGFSGTPVPAIWKKGQSPGQTLQPDMYLANSYEMFFYLKKGSPKLRKLGRSNIFDFSPQHPSRRIHPTERPPDLMLEILRTFGWEGAKVLVPFAGSGSTIQAAYNLNMTALGFDLSMEFKNAFSVRIMREIEGE